MASSINGGTLLLTRKIIASSCCRCIAPTVRYSIKKTAGGKLGKGIGPAVTKKKFPVETDPEKLVSYCCGSNIYKQGEDIKLLPDNEYPDWLWTVRIGKPPPLEELDPETMEYWAQLRKMAKKRENRLRSLRKF